jgi:DoxX-like family
MSSTVVTTSFGPAVREGHVPRTVAYWGATGVVTIVPLLAAFAYLTTSPEAVENFRHVGYPQQLRVLLGVAKLAGAIVLLLPRLPLLKEWAYAGFTFMWIAASVAHYLAGDKPLFLLPITLIAVLAVSYVTRSPDRRISADARRERGR